jgi:DNA-binding transcriptional LysR family regulator
MKLVIAEIPIAGYINQISQILQPVAKGLGFTVLPKSAIESFPDTNLLQVYKPAKQVIETLYTVTKKNRVLPARYEAINAVLSSSMGR